MSGSSDPTEPSDATRDRLVAAARQQADPLDQWRHDDETVDLIDQLKQATGDAADLLSRTNTEGFLQDRILQRAATAILIQVGEAANSLDRDFQALYPAVNWNAAYKMRNKLAHHYDTVDPHVLWDTLSTNLPQLADALDLPSW